MDIQEHIDLQRWLINSNMINDLHKDTLFMYGCLLHKDIASVEVAIDVAAHRVDYTLYLPTRLIGLKQKMDRLSGGQSIIDLWRYKRMLKKHGNLNFSSMASRFVRDYLGPSWDAHVKILDEKEYDAAPYQPQAIDAPGTTSV